MNPQRDKKNMISYPPAALQSFYAYRYEWIDNLNFTLMPEACLDDPEPYVEIAREIFLETGWEGDGSIELIWIPPFVLRSIGVPETSSGIVVWHVKQLEDGLSWLLSPVKLPIP